MNSNVMMHANNFFWQGGVPMFIYDMIETFPEFHHVVVYMHDEARFGGENFDMMQDWMNATGCEIAKVDLITPELLREINPAVVCLNSIAGDKLAGPNHDWLREWPVIFFHHNKTRPIIPAGLDVFVSDYLKRMWGHTVRQMQRVINCPPVIDVAPYLEVERKVGTSTCVIGKLCSAWNSKKYPMAQYDIMREVGQKRETVSFKVVGGARHHRVEELKVPRLEFIREMSMHPRDMLRQMDIMLYTNDPTWTETWCRAVTEAMVSGIPCIVENRGGPVEQIEHGVDGFICDTHEQYVECALKLVDNPQLRYDMGMRAREKAAKHFGKDRLRRELTPYLMQALIGTL